MWKMRSAYEIYISIHVPARGTTDGDGALFALSENFNPRPREGDDGQGFTVG